MVVFDTDLLVGLLRGDKSAISKIKEIEQQKIKVFTTSISSYELFKGAYLSSNPLKVLSQVIKLIDNINVLNFDLGASNTSARIYSYLKKKGKLTNAMDQIIAAITILNNETLITRNIEHYKNIPQLKMQKW